MSKILKRMFDVTGAIVLLILLILPMFCIAVLIKVTSRGAVIYWSDRIGQDNRIFRMPKFRTMKVGTPAKATHLLDNPDRHLTSIGKFLRSTSVDELPQLYSILRGEMSFVGPRPALFNQHDLVSYRTKLGIHHLKPGLTGWAQINGRDDVPIAVKVVYDEYYLHHQSFLFDCKIMLLTFSRVIRREGVQH